MRNGMTMHVRVIIELIVQTLWAQSGLVVVAEGVNELDEDGVSNEE